jgi:transcriptional regulator with XRE-family HTH domain
MKTTPIREALDRIGLTQGDLASAMGVDPSTISNKLAGRRSWSREEINAALAFLRKFEPGLSYEQLFDATEAPERVES